MYIRDQSIIIGLSERISYTNLSVSCVWMDSIIQAHFFGSSSCQMFPAPFFWSHLSFQSSNLTSTGSRVSFSTEKYNIMLTVGSTCTVA